MPKQDFVPDSRCVDEVRPSPNHDGRTAALDMVLLHYTGMPTTQGALERLCEAAAKVSAHYVVADDGRIVQLVPEGRRAWHAGLSSWAGVTDINSCSIGVEIANPGHDAGCPGFPDAQIDAVIALCRDVVARHAIRPERVLGHSDVAPQRKRDPGEMFPWRRLHDAGIGLWVAPAPIGPSGGSGGASSGGLGPGDAGDAVARLQADLAHYGYGVARTTHYDAATASVVTAFQRHFRPARVDGIADRSTVATLQALLAARDGRR